MPIPRKPETPPKIKQKGVKKKSRVLFAQKLNKNIAKYSKQIIPSGASITLAHINYDFCYELTLIFMETLTQILLENNTMNFDQFGKFEIKEHSPKKMKSPLTGEEIDLPSFKIIRFYPTKILKERIKGLRSGSKKKMFGQKAIDNVDFTEEYDNEDDEFDEEEN